MAILLLPGFLIGIGGLLLKIFKVPPKFSTSFATSLLFWSVIGWLPIHHMDILVFFFSIIGLYGVIFIKYDKEKNIIFLGILALILRYIITLPFTLSFGNDTIMHSYTVLSLYHAKGYTPVFYPFHVNGLGAFNIGFHFVATSLMFLLRISALKATIVTGFIFFMLFYLSINEWLENPFISLLVVFTLVRPSNFPAWGGFPTLASIAYIVFAFKYPLPLSMLFWTGAFSTHFIPAVAAFVPYVIINLKDKKLYTSSALMFSTLSLQYYKILTSNLVTDRFESLYIDNYIIRNTWKSLFVVVLLGLLAIIPYIKKMKVKEKIPLWAAAFPVILGLISSAFGIMHIPFNPVKSFYLGRVIVPLIIPASFGLFFLFKKYRFTGVVLPFLGLTLITLSHKKHSRDRATWDMIKSFVNTKYEDNYYSLVRYNSVASYLPALGKPAWHSHYLITLISEFTDKARKSRFLYVFVKEGDTLFKKVVIKYQGKPVDNTNSMQIYRLQVPVSGDSIISMIQPTN